MLDEDSWTVLESEKECEQKRMRRDNLKGGGAAWGKAESAKETKFGRHAGSVWGGLIWGYTFSGTHSAGPVVAPRHALG